MTAKGKIATAVGGSALGHLLLVSVAIGWVAAGGIPDNDHFSLRSKLGDDDEIVAIGSNYAASRERGEPVHAGSEPQSGSIWWSWLAPKGATDVLVEVELQGFDPLVAVYRGFAVERLETVAASKNGTLSFEPKVGDHYHIAVAGNGRDAEGVIKLRLQAYSDGDREEPEPEEETALLLPDIIIEEKRDEDDQARFVRTSQNDPEARSTVDPQFESDRNTVAASETAPDENGLENMPSQDGTDLPFLEMKNREKVRGELRDDATIPIAAVEVKSAPVSVAETMTDETLLAETGEFAGQKLGKEAREGEADTDSENKLVETPEVMVEDGNVFQAESHRNKIAGTAEVRGSTAAVDAAETPLGRYNRLVTSAVDKQWADERARRNVSLPFGSLKVSFAVDAEGNAGSLKIIEDQATAKVKDFFLDVILSADIPPMPEDVREQLGGQPLVIPYSIFLN